VKHYGSRRRHQDLAARCGELLAEVRRLQARLESVERASLPKEAACLPAATPPDPRALAAVLPRLRGEAPRPRGGRQGEAAGLRAALRGRPRRGARRRLRPREFLELLREEGIPASGVDLDAEMAACARAKGLDAVTGDLFAHLEALPDASLGGVFAAQVVEHLTTAELVALVRLARAKLAPGGRFLAETVNPTCLATFAGAFYLDLTTHPPDPPRGAALPPRGQRLHGGVPGVLSPMPRT